MKRCYVWMDRWCGASSGITVQHRTKTAHNNADENRTVLQTHAPIIYLGVIQTDTAFLSFINPGKTGKIVELTLKLYYAILYY